MLSRSSFLSVLPPTSAISNSPKLLQNFLSVVGTAPSLWNILLYLAGQNCTTDSSSTLSKKPSQWVSTLSPQISTVLPLPTAPTSTPIVAVFLKFVITGILIRLLHQLTPSSSESGALPFISLLTLPINVAWLKLGHQATFQLVIRITQGSFNCFEYYYTFFQDK